MHNSSKYKLSSYKPKLFLYICPNFLNTGFLGDFLYLQKIGNNTADIATKVQLTYYLPKT